MGAPHLGQRGTSSGGDGHLWTIAGGPLQPLPGHLKALGLHHPADRLLVVVGHLVTGLGALPQAVVPLGVKQAALVKSGFLKAVVHIGGQHKIIFIRYQLQQVLVHRLGRIAVAVEENKPAPVGPMLLQGGKWIKSPGIHIVEIVFFLEVRKITVELRSAISKSGGCRKARSGTN